MDVCKFYTVREENHFNGSTFQLILTNLYPANPNLLKEQS